MSKVTLRTNGLQPGRSLRARRVVLALLRGPQTRPDLDVASGSTSSPTIVRGLRLAGIDIKCQMFPASDAYGADTYVGIYYLCPEAARAARSWLARDAIARRRFLDQPTIGAIRSMVDKEVARRPYAAAFSKTLCHAFGVSSLSRLPRHRRGEYVGCFLSRTYPSARSEASKKGGQSGRKV